MLNIFVIFTSHSSTRHALSFQKSNIIFFPFVSITQLFSQFYYIGHFQCKRCTVITLMISFHNTDWLWQVMISPHVIISRIHKKYMKMHFWLCCDINDSIEKWFNEKCVWRNAITISLACIQPCISMATTLRIGCVTLMSNSAAFKHAHYRMRCCCWMSSHQRFSIHMELQLIQQAE